MGDTESGYLSGDGSISDLQAYASQLEQEWGLPTGFLSAQINAESSWVPTASNGNAYGLAQFMPATAQEYGVDPTDPYSSLEGAAEYDSDLYNTTGSWQSVLSSYGTTAGNALNTSASAQQANQIAADADAGLDGSQGASGMGLTPWGNTSSNAATPAQSQNPTSSGSSWFSQFTSWISSEKYNAIGIFVGALLMLLGVWKMLDNSGQQVVSGIAEGV